MGIAKKTDGRYVVGIGVADANDYKGSAAYRDIFIQLTESGASDKSLDYLNYLKDYAIYHNSLGEPIMPPSVNVWISNHGVTTAVEADDLSLDGSNYTIGGIKWDGSAWDYTNAGQGSGGGGGGTGGNGGTFPVEILIEEGQARSSKTLSEIISAVNSGLFPYLFIDINGGITMYPCVNISAENGALFALTSAINDGNGGILGINSAEITVHADGSVTQNLGNKRF